MICGEVDMSRKNGANRVIFLYLTAAFFVFFLVVVPYSSGKSLASASEWSSIITENAGLLSLPADWKIISRDETTERGPGSGFAFNVQQVLYAEPETSADFGISLQVFSIWSSDPEGRVASLPPELLEQAGEDLAGGLINGRYGYARRLDREVLQTHIVGIPVTTWCVDASEGSGIRYKCVTLFHGEKLVLALGRYLPDHEVLWSRQFEDIVNKWVSSLTLTPAPMPEALMVEVPLPEMAQTMDIISLADKPVPTVSEHFSDVTPAAVVTAVQVPPEEGVEEEILESFPPVYYGIPAALIFVGLLAARIVGKRRNNNGRLASFQKIVPVPITAEELRTDNASSSRSSSSTAEEKQLSDLSAAEAPVASNSTEGEAQMEIEEASQEIVETDNDCDFNVDVGHGENNVPTNAVPEDLPAAEKRVSSHPFDRICPEDMELPPLSSTYDDPDRPSVWEEISTATDTLVQSVPEEAGFEKVYTLINQALEILESYKDMMPAPRYYSNMPETPSVYTLQTKSKNVVEKEPPNLSPISTNAGEFQFGDNMAEAPDPYGLKWLYICAFALMTIADVTVAVLFAQISNAELLLSQLWETIPVLLENTFILMGASCLLALAIRFTILRRPMHRGGLHLLASMLSVALGTSLFSLGTLYFLSVLPGIGIMQACALTVSFYLSYRTLIYRYVDDSEEESETVEIRTAAKPERAATIQERTVFHEETKADVADRKEEFASVSDRHSDNFFRELEASFGTSYILDLLEDEVRNALENEEGSLQLIRARDVSPDCPILKFCCNTLINLIQTGRYHIGRGILSNEGQELLDLFNHIANRLLRSECDISGEVLGYSDLIQRCIREQG